MAHDVFISYASADQTVAHMVCATLEQQGIRCWMAPRDVQPGDDWGNAIVDAIKASRAMVLVFSGAANESHHIPRELERAIGREIPIVPVRIENVEPRGSLEYSLSSVHWLDAITPPVEAHIVKLADRLRTIVHRPADAGPPVIVPVPRPPSKRGLIITGAAVAIAILIYALSHQPPTAATPSPVPPSAPTSTPATPSPTSTAAPETFHVDPNAAWSAFPAHRIGGVDPRRIAELKREADAHPDDERPALDLAVIYYDSRRYDDAIVWFKDALERVPDHLGARTDLAMAYWHINRDTDARSHLQRVLGVEPRNPLALLNLGVVSATARQFAEAAECWRRVIEYQPGTWEASRAREMLDKIGAR